MSRAAFLSAGGDPFLFVYSLNFFKNVYQNEVDKLYVCYNGQTDEKVVNFIKYYADYPSVEFIYVKEELGYGKPIEIMLDKSHQDLILLLEDDGYIYKREVVNNCFKWIENNEYDLVGSPRMSCGVEIAEVSAKKYGLDYSGEGDKGPNFWPNFLFLKRKDLMNTDRVFTGKGWKSGEYIKELDHICQTDQAGDTFVWVCMQLRNMGLRVKEVPQWHASPTEEEDKNERRGHWKEKPFGWIHAGSLSAGWNLLLRGEYSPIPNDYALQELETRVAFWKIVSDFEPFEEIAEFKKSYQEGIANLIDHYHMNTDRINRKIDLYNHLMDKTW